MSSRAVLRNHASRPARVTADGRLISLAVRRDYRLACGSDRQWAFSCAEDAVTPDGAKVFAYLSNGHLCPLVIDRIKINIASTEVVSVKVGNAYTAAGGAALTAVSRAVGGSNALSTRGTFYGGVDVTGAGSDMAEVHSVKLASGVDKVIDLSRAPIVLLKNHCLTLSAGTGSTAASYEIQCHWADVPYVDG